ncbi:hypothetical protein CDL12_00353 [Handroanthus impetiginosus]|uniref:S-protein homolog n=1 Tax=Handroanthus impetiginosus TaxID=429701 RepID=A0A2G9IB17_9LAMI|nr:hypothetical protein CDL12_00353 [Handroanthus impetiginosus]
MYDVNGDFNWHFKTNFWLTTLFFCRFQRLIGRSYCEVDHGRGNNTCLWSVKQDGFYIGNHIPPTNLTKLHDW